MITIDMMETQRNFVADPEKFGTKFFPKDTTPIITVCGKNFKKRETGAVENIQVFYNFSSFEFPNLKSLFGRKITSIGENSKSLCLVDNDVSTNKDETIEDIDVNPETTLIISVDNSFDIYEPEGADLVISDTDKEKELETLKNSKFCPKKMNFIFIDHHLYETKMEGCPYQSNSIMIYSNFILILKVLNKILSEKQIDKVGVLFHTDLDGIGAGLLIAKILELIKAGKADTAGQEDIDSVGIAMVLGEYGDISDNKEEDLIDVFSPSNFYSAGLNAKMTYITKNLGRFMKAIRPVIDSYAHVRSNSHIEGLKEKYNEFKFKYGLGYDEFKEAYLKIKTYFNDIQTLDAFTIISFVSKIVQDPVNAAIISLVQKEIDAICESYLRPDTPQFECNVQFTNFDVQKRWPEYKILLIDSPLDVGRSVMWSYRGRLQYFKEPAESKKFTMALYKAAIPFILKTCKSICCYNMFSGKLSLQSEDDSAFEIGKAFGGGGHGGTSSGSLGSVMVDLETLKKHIIITEVV